MFDIKKVIVTLKEGVDVDAFIEEMSARGYVSPHVPERAVEIANLRPESLYNVDFYMDLEETNSLRNDPRVEDCIYGTLEENGFFPKIHATNPTKTFTRSSSFIAPNNTDVNWGLVDCYSTTNPFSTNAEIGSTNYTLDGTGVDVVIQDSGLQVDHPEFQDSNGVSRVKQINWYQAAGVVGTQPPGFYSDYDGHGTNVGSIAVGKTYGWARNANIYVMTILGQNLVTGVTNAQPPVATTAQPHQLSTGDIIEVYVPYSWGILTGGTSYYFQVTVVTTTQIRIDNIYTGSGWVYVTTIGYGPYPGGFKITKIYDSSFNYKGQPNSIDELTSLGLIRRWHLNKPIDPVTGFRRPTIVNMSWGYHFSLTNSITGGVYRGTTWSGSFPQSQYGMLLTNQLPLPDDGGSPAYISAVNSEITACLNAGIIMVGAAGNNSYKIDVLGGADYNNYGTSTSYPGVRWYYHRGSSPTAVPGVVCVGAIDYTFQGGGSYSITNATAKSNFSATGPRVDVYAPGGFIAGATCNNAITGYFPVVNYPTNSNYKSMKESGTSQASPQVAGVLACVLQMRPWMSYNDAQTWIRENSVPKTANVSGYYSSADFSSYSDTYSLQGSTNRYLYYPYQLANNARITGSTTFRANF
jgi:hypothetical protein